jgi:hypothetical protein
MRRFDDRLNQFFVSLQDDLESWERNAIREDAVVAVAGTTAVVAIGT